MSRKRSSSHAGICNSIRPAKRDVPKADRLPNHYNSRKVSYYVMKTLGLVVGPQSNLMVVRLIGDHQDKIKMICRAMRRLRGVKFVTNTRFCYDEVDRIVYALCENNLDPDYMRSKILHVENVGMTFCSVGSISQKEGSFEAFVDIPASLLYSPLPVDPYEDPATIEMKTVCLFVAEYLPLVVGPQSRLFAIVGLDDLVIRDKVKLASRAVQSIRGGDSLSSFKFVFDWASDTVFLLVPDLTEAMFLKGIHLSVQGQSVFFCQVKNVSLSNHATTEYCNEDLRITKFDVSDGEED